MIFTRSLRVVSCFFFVLSTITLSAQVDPDASDKTVILYTNLKHIQNGSSFLFGQEFFNSFRYNSSGAHGDEEFSDSKDVTGAHPALLGSDFHYYLEKSAGERGFHTDAVKWAYQQGYVITFDWHISARGTTTYEYSDVPAVKNLVNNIVDNLNGDRAWFFGELDKVIAIINNDLVVNNTKIPIVFRPLHEMNGGWFWWGSKATTSTNYKAFYQLVVDYMKPKVNSVLFCWSPNSPTNMDYYPGDAYVDVLGVDIYEVNASSLRSNLAPIVDHAQANNKVAVLSETGNRTNNGTAPGDNAVLYWLNTVLPAILDDPSGKARKIAWVLTWINASWSYPYLPHSGSSAAAKQSFKDFKNSPNVLFGDKISNMYTPRPVVTGVEHAPDDYRLEVFPVPVRGTLNLRLTGFQFPARIRVYDVLGKLIFERESMTEEISTSTEGLSAGLYLLKVSDAQRSVSRRIALEK